MSKSIVVVSFTQSVIGWNSISTRAASTFSKGSPPSPVIGALSAATMFSIVATSAGRKSCRFRPSSSLTLSNAEGSVWPLASIRGRSRPTSVQYSA